MYFLVENPVKCVNEKEKIIPIGFYILPYHFTKKIATIFLTVFFREIGQSKKCFLGFKTETQQQHNVGPLRILAKKFSLLFSSSLYAVGAPNSIRTRFENSYVVKR